MPIILDGTNGAFLPTWTTGTRPASPANGEIGYNSTTAQLDQYVGGAWSSVPTGSAAAATPTVLGTVYGKTGTTQNTYVGYNAGLNTTGNYNSALGTDALKTNTTGEQITAIGWNSGKNSTGTRGSFLGCQAGQDCTGTDNTGVGNQALQQVSTGASNTGVGSYALAGATAVTGSFNTAVGKDAGYNTTTDAGTVAIGHQALFSNTTGSGDSHNVAVGKQAMYNNATGYYSIGIGYRALYNMNATGSNTAVGYKAGQNTTSGSGNTFIGIETGKVCTTGSANIHLGYGTSTSATGAANEIVISTNSDTGKGNQTGFIAPGFGSCYQGSNSSSWATTSDRRLKKNITDNTEGLDKITQIRVRNFEYRLPEEVDAELKSTDAVRKTGVQLGVIAQELQAVLPDCVKEESTGVLRVDSDNLTWCLINAVKELKAELDALKAKVA